MFVKTTIKNIGVIEEKTEKLSEAIFTVDIPTTFSSVSGAIYNLPDGSPYIISADGLTVTTSSEGQIVISGEPISSSFVVLNDSFTVLSNSFVPVSDSIDSLNTSFTTLSNSLAEDVEFFQYPQNLVDSTGDRTILSSDNGKFIFMSGSTTNITRIPNTLPNGFNCFFVQASSSSILVVSTETLKFPRTFLSRSAELNSIIFVYSGSLGLYLGGDLALSGS